MEYSKVKRKRIRKDKLKPGQLRKYDNKSLNESKYVQKRIMEKIAKNNLRPVEQREVKGIALPTEIDKELLSKKTLATNISWEKLESYAMFGLNCLQAAKLLNTNRAALANSIKIKYGLSYNEFKESVQGNIFYELRGKLAEIASTKDLDPDTQIRAIKLLEELLTGSGKGLKIENNILNNFSQETKQIRAKIMLKLPTNQKAKELSLLLFV